MHSICFSTFLLCPSSLILFCSRYTLNVMLLFSVLSLSYFVRLLSIDGPSLLSLQWDTLLRLAAWYCLPVRQTLIAAILSIQVSQEWWARSSHIMECRLVSDTLLKAHYVTVTI